MSPSETLKPANSMIASLGHRDAGALEQHQDEDAGVADRVDDVDGDVDDRIDDEVGQAGDAARRDGGAERVHARRGTLPASSATPAVDSQARWPASPTRSTGRRALELVADALLAARRLLARVQAPLPRRARRDPRPLRDDARRLDRLRRDRQDAGHRAVRPAPEVVALLPPPRPLAAGPRARRRQRRDGDRLRARPAVRRQPAALGRDLRLPALGDLPRRRAARPAHARRAARRAGTAARRDARRARRRRRLGRADGRPRAEAQPRTSARARSASSTTTRASAGCAPRASRCSARPTRSARSSTASAPTRS